MNSRLKKLLIENHPDRHGGDHSHMEKVFAARTTSIKQRKHCKRCGVVITGLAEFCLTCFRLPKLALNSQPSTIN